MTAGIKVPPVLDVLLRFRDSASMTDMPVAPRAAAQETIFQIYFNRRIAVLVALGFASGLPNVLAQDTLKAWLSQAGIDIKQIGLFSLVTLPYVFKFLWAPLMDRFVPPFLGRRRGWLAVTQAGLALGLLAVAFCGPRTPDAWLVPLAVAGTLVVFLSASQDIVADAYRTDILPPAELGAGAAIFVMGYRVAMIVSGAGALFLAARFGWPAAYGLMAVLMGLGVAATFFAPEPSNATAPVSLKDAVWEPLRQFFGSRGVIAALYVLVFILLFKLPDVLCNAMTMPFLIKDLGYTPNQIGAIRQFIGFFIVIVGALGGGIVVSRIGVIRSLWIFGVLQALSNAGFWLLANIGNDRAVFQTIDWSAGTFTLHMTLTRGLAWLIGVIAVESLCAGLVTAGFVAFLMSQCDRRFSAFQYAILSAVTAATIPLFGSLTGFLVDKVGYAQFFLLTILFAVPGMALLPWLKEKKEAAIS